MIDQILKSLPSSNTNNKFETPGQEFSREINRMPPKDKNIYIPRHLLSTVTWDQTIDKIQLLEIKVNYLEKTDEVRKRTEENQYEMIEALKAEIDEIKSKTWQDNLINTIYGNPVLTVMYLGLTFAILFCACLIISMLGLSIR